MREAVHTQMHAVDMESVDTPGTALSVWRVALRRRTMGPSHGTPAAILKNATRKTRPGDRMSGRAAWLGYDSELCAGDASCSRLRG